MYLILFLGFQCYSIGLFVASVPCCFNYTGFVVRSGIECGETFSFFSVPELFLHVCFSMWTCLALQVWTILIRLVMRDYDLRSHFTARLQQEARRKSPSLWQKRFIGGFTGQVICSVPRSYSTVRGLWQTAHKLRDSSSKIRLLTTNPLD